MYKVSFLPALFMDVSKNNKIYENIISKEIIKVFINFIK